MFQNKNKIQLALIFLVVILSFSFLFWKGSSYFFEKNNETKQENVNAKREQIKKEVDAVLGDYLKNLKPNGIEASAIVIDKLEDLLKNNKDLDLESEALIKNYLGDNYLVTDRPKGIELLKEVIKDSNYSNADRATAITILEGSYEMIPNRFDNLFTGDFFGDFIKDVDVATAFNELNEFSNTLEPKVITNYRMALYWTNQMGLAVSADKKNESQAKAIELLAKTDPITFQIDKEKAWFSELKKGIAYRIRSQALENLYFSGNQKQAVPIEVVVDSYKKSISTLETAPVDRYMYLQAPYSRFFYASFLAKADPQKYSEEIKNVLAPICNSASYGKYPIYGFLSISLKNNRDLPASIIQVKQALNKLIQIDPDFKELLIKVVQDETQIKPSAKELIIKEIQDNKLGTR